MIHAHDNIGEASVLTRAAELWGIERRYWDIWGKEHHAPDEVQMAILKSLGVDTSTPDSLERAIRDREQRQWTIALPPTLVLSETVGPARIPFSTLAADAHEKVTLFIAWESGEVSTADFVPADLPTLAEAVLDGRSYTRKEAPIPGANLPLGYHIATLSRSGQPIATCRLIVCPDRAWQPDLVHNRSAGVGISLYGLRSSRNWGCGDFTDLERLAEWVADDVSASFIALNPLHAIANRQPYNTSPYLPNSSFYKNFIYLDLEKVEDFDICPHARRILNSESVQREIQALRDSAFVEYERVHRMKFRFLKLLFRTFLRSARQDTQRHWEFQSYIEREGDLLHRYAVHSALDEWLHKKGPTVWNWRAWPEVYQTPESPETKAFAARHWRSVLLHKYIQWQIDFQLQKAHARAKERSLSIGLYHDLALATDSFGSDLWAHRDFYVGGCRVGSPPDNFSPKGQDWAFPPPNSDRHYQDGYRLFVESIRKNCSHGGALRIDHVMRFFHLYWIPDGVDALHGTYVQDRHDDLLRILALESVRQKVVVVGEDLGTVPDSIRESLNRFGILGYRLFYFEQDKNGQFRLPEAYPAQALVSVTTHDLPTLAGFWLNRDIEARRRAGVLLDDEGYSKMLGERMQEKQKILDLLFELKLLPDWFPRRAVDIPELTGELHSAVVGFLAQTPAQLLVLNQEDLFKETEQQNLPGTTAEYPNWRRKTRFRIEELREPSMQDFTRMFRGWLDRTGRLNRR